MRPSVRAPDLQPARLSELGRAPQGCLKFDNLMLVDMASAPPLPDQTNPKSKIQNPKSPNPKNPDPKKKTSFVWGQSINHKEYESKLGFCFKTFAGKEDKLKINFYNQYGKVKTVSKVLKPKKSYIVDISKFFGNTEKLGFYWYSATTTRPDLSAYSFHINKKTGNSSGEHNF